MAIENVYHIRRCHVCGTVNEMRNAAIHQCSQCEKHLAPFYYFDESGMKGLTDDGIEMSAWNEHPGYHPIWGLSTYWEADPLEDPQKETP